MKRTVAVIFLFALLVSVLVSACKIQFANAQTTTIYINADGSITPSSTPISTVDNITYTFTGNMSYPTYSGIVVERNNIVIDGNGYTVQGDNSTSSIGLSLSDINNVTIKNVNIKGFGNGIKLLSSSDNTVSGNNVTEGDDGIDLGSSSNDTISGNNVTANLEDGMVLGSSSNNTLSGNFVIANSYYGIYLFSSSNNTLSGNNATADFDGIYLFSSSNNNFVSGNDATKNIDDGIYLDSSSNNTITDNNLATNNQSGIFFAAASSNTVNDNNVTANSDGIDLNSYSNNNAVVGNNVTANEDGIYLSSSSKNSIYHNRFIGNVIQAHLDPPSLGNSWDNGYPSGGNFWSDYNGTDRYSGRYQNVTGSDGIGDTPYVIDANNMDNFPLMNPVVVPEFQLSQLLILFITATVLAVIIHRKKPSRTQETEQKSER